MTAMGWNMAIVNDDATVCDVHNCWSFDCRHADAYANYSLMKILMKMMHYIVTSTASGSVLAEIVHDDVSVNVCTVHDGWSFDCSHAGVQKRFSNLLEFMHVNDILEL